MAGSAVRAGIGVAFLFSGAALLAHLLGGIALWAAALAATAVLGVVLWRVFSQVDEPFRGVLARTIGVGALAGALATAGYDATKAALAALDPSSANPFEALPVFGTLLLGGAAPPAARWVTGTAFHVVNGVSFGIAYCLLFGRRGVVAGIAWGLVLEGFQLTLYPGWLDVRLLQEFTVISGVSHVAYGVVLGATCRRALGARFDRGVTL